MNGGIRIRLYTNITVLNNQTLVIDVKQKQYCKNDDGKWFLYSYSMANNQFTIEAEIKDEESNAMMNDSVMKSPAMPVGDAIRKIKLEIVEKFEPTFWNLYWFWVLLEQIIP